MSIRVLCPNGHELKVKEDLAGRTGLCPFCKAQVKVPQRPPAEFEDAMLGVLGAKTSKAASEVVATERPQKKPDNTPPRKLCFKCGHEVAACIHICPHCHTYIAKPTDF